jgi:hypothetical protein
MDNTPGEGERPAAYLSYLLRLWREGEGGARWRASLYDPLSGERLGFGSVEDLFAFLEGKMGTASSPREGQTGGAGGGAGAGDRRKPPG